MNKLLFRLKKLKRMLLEYEVYKWFKDGGDENLRLSYDLNSESIFFELGGYLGNYTKKILDKFNPVSYIFEPSKEYFDFLTKTFNQENVMLINKGLSNFVGDSQLLITGDSSFVSHNNSEDSSSETIELIKLSDFVKENNIRKIDLININIEGSEYDVLEDMLDNNTHLLVKSFQIQFHKNVPNYKIKREKIQHELSKTHKQAWNYNYVWERWDLKG